MAVGVRADMAVPGGGAQACVALLCEVGAYDDAVRMALGFDDGLAADVARRPQDPQQRRALWLAIATHKFANQAPDAEVTLWAACKHV